jgi:hypothetical protein
MSLPAERLAEIRERLTKVYIGDRVHEYPDGYTGILRDAEGLLAEVDRLTAELMEAREHGWAEYDAAVFLKNCAEAKCVRLTARVKQLEDAGNELDRVLCVPDVALADSDRVEQPSDA